MKKIISTLTVLLLITQLINAQTNNKATYSIKLVEDFFSFNATLVFNSYKSYFVTKQHKGPIWFIDDNENLNTQELVTDTIGYVVYRDLKTKTTIVREFCDVNKPLVYEDSVKIKWKLGSKSQKIQGLKCKNAFTTFRGRKYEAWYAPQIPTNAGPWKFYGLPGLITKVSEVGGVVSIIIKSFSTKSTDKILQENLQINTTITAANECLDEEWQRFRKRHAVTIAKMQAEYPDIEISGSLPKTRRATEKSLAKQYKE